MTIAGAEAGAGLAGKSAACATSEVPKRAITAVVDINIFFILFSRIEKRLGLTSL
jgi:hypothetical protein